MLPAREIRPIPSTRTSRTLSEPASVNSAARIRSMSVGLLHHRCERTALRRPQVHQIRALAGAEIADLVFHAQRLRSRARRQIKQMRGDQQRAVRREPLQQYACRPSLSMPNPVPPPTSVPSAHFTPAAMCRRSGNIPLPSAALLHGQCEIAVPLAASRSSSESVGMNIVRHHRRRCPPAQIARTHSNNRKPRETAARTSAISCRFSLRCV